MLFGQMPGFDQATGLSPDVSADPSLLVLGGYNLYIFGIIILSPGMPAGGAGAAPGGGAGGVIIAMPPIGPPFGPLARWSQPMALAP